MTDSLPGFTFDQKSGELSRGGKRIALKYKHAWLFNALLASVGEFVPTRDLCEVIDGIKADVATEMMYLRARISRMGMAIEATRGVGYRLVVGEMPKWSPTIPPVTDDPALMKMPT